MAIGACADAILSSLYCDDATAAAGAGAAGDDESVATTLLLLMAAVGMPQPLPQLAQYPHSIPSHLLGSRIVPSTACRTMRVVGKRAVAVIPATANHQCNEKGSTTIGDPRVLRRSKCIRDVMS